MKIEIGKHYLIRQRYQYGNDRHDDIMVLKCVRMANKNECLDYGPETVGYFGTNVKQQVDSDHFFVEGEVISSIKV